MKTCTRCNETKSLDAFGKGSGYRDGRRSRCKDCESQRQREWRLRNPAKVRAQNARNNARRRKAGKGAYDPARQEQRRRQARESHLRRKYGIGLDEFDAIKQDQDGRCRICRELPTVALGGGQTEPDLVVDHCHTTGRVRGLLCNGCNVAIAHAREDPDILRAMIAYVTDR